MPIMKKLVTQIDDAVSIQNILLSVSDKGGLEEFVPALLRLNPSMGFYSTGGTHARLEEILGASSRERLRAVSDYTGQPEMEGGLVKTLDFKIYLGLLSETYNEAHGEDLKRARAVRFDMVVVNLYPFAETVAQKDTRLEEARADIDIGGPCMLRSSAKNFLRVTPVCDPSDYPSILEDMENHGGAVPFARRLALAKKAFTHTAEYEAVIAAYLGAVTPTEAAGNYEFQNRGPGNE